MWELLEDFLEQPLLMKVYIAWGWLAVLIMVLSMWTKVPELVSALSETPKAAAEAPAHH